MNERVMCFVDLKYTMRNRNKSKSIQHVQIYITRGGNLRYDFLFYGKAPGVAELLLRVLSFSPTPTHCTQVYYTSLLVKFIQFNPIQ